MSTVRLLQPHRPTTAAEPLGEPPPRRPLLPGVPGYPLAVVVLAVGVGTGPSHLSREGIGAPGGVGTALLVAGVVGAGWCGLRVLRATRKRWWAATLPALLLVLYLGLWIVAQAVGASVVARPPLGEGTPADRGLTYEDVRFPTRDGVELAGWWVPSRNGAAVVLRHGSGGTRSGLLDHAEVLADHGFGVLMVDARGHGESDGRAMDFGWWGEQDTVGAVDFLADQPGVEAIGVVGLSMGGEEAIGAAGADPRIQAVVAEGATARIAADREWLSAYGLRGEVQQAIDAATFGLAGWLTPAPEPMPLATAVVEAAPTPLLLVVAGEVEDEGLAADRLREASPDTVTTWTVPGAGHTRGLDEAPEEWEQRVVGFLTSALLPDQD